MTTLDDKRVDWLYQHFQGITKRSDQFLVLFGILFVSAVAVLSSSNDPIELPFLKVEAGRETLLGCTILSAVFTLVAFFGNYDYGERALLELCKAINCEYEDIWFIDTHPTIVDFARHRRDAASNKRRLPARASAALLYPLLLLSALAVLSAIWAHEVWLRSMSLLEAAPYILALPVLYVAWDRGMEYIGRRWKAWRAAEVKRQVQVQESANQAVASAPGTPAAPTGNAAAESSRSAS